jgi:hypothetical protein
MFSDSRTRAENFGISIGRHGRGQSRAPLGYRRSESGARRASAPACAVSRETPPGTRVVFASNSRANPALLLRLRTASVDGHRRVSAQSGAQTRMQRGPLREMENPTAMRDSAVARPGLEPGTPRFSVVTSRACEDTQSLENTRFRRSARSTATSAIAGLSPRFRGWLASHPLFEPTVAEAVYLVRLLEERADPPRGERCHSGSRRPGIAASVRRLNSAALAGTHERRSAAVVGEVTR